jgi:hypothetical protein
MEWRSRNQKPEPNQICHIRGEGEYIILGVCYKADGDLFLNLFATAQEGHVYARSVIVAWLPAEDITDPPDEFYDEVFVP